MSLTISPAGVTGGGSAPLSYIYFSVPQECYYIADGNNERSNDGVNKDGSDNQNSTTNVVHTRAYGKELLHRQSSNEYGSFHSR